MSVEKFYLVFDSILEGEINDYVSRISLIPTIIIEEDEDTLIVTIDSKHVKELFQQLFYLSHPFYEIYDSNENKIVDLDFYEKEYLLYNVNQENDMIVYVYLMILKTVEYFKNKQSNENLKKIPILKIIDPYSSYKTLPIEFLLYLEQSLQRVNIRKYVSKEFNYQIPILKSTKQPFKTQFSSIVQDQQQLKQLREESIKARVKLKISQYEIDWLDVKFHKDDVHITTSILLDFEEKEEFEEFISQYLYQAEFISSVCISIIVPFEIDLEILKEFKLKVVEKIEVEHPFKENIPCYFYIIDRE